MPPLPKYNHLYENGLISYNTFFRLEWTRQHLLSHYHSLLNHQKKTTPLTPISYEVQDFLLHQEYFRTWGVDDICVEFLKNGGHHDEYGDAMTEWETWIDNLMDQARQM